MLMADARTLAIVGDLLDTLKGRKGFAAWWDALEPSTRKEIRRTLVDKIDERLNGKNK